MEQPTHNIPPLPYRPPGGLYDHPLLGQEGGPHLSPLRVPMGYEGGRMPGTGIWGAAVPAPPVYHPAGEAVIAPIWRRVVGFVFDLLVCDLLSGILGNMASSGMALASAHPDAWEYADALSLEFYTAALLPVWLAYFVFFTAHGGRTPGQMVFRLEVETDAGDPPGWRRALGRTLCFPLVVLTLGTGFLAALVPGGKAVQDRMAGTRVVYRPTR
ncbi:MAG: RDD family protein [Nitrospirota bacterium]|nr:RDD family protein [Nitrospirota bacterium]